MSSDDSDRSDRESPALARNMKRCNKQLMEKKRRGRINSSLDDLKALVLQASNKDSAQYSKLEKADILEMTVKHLRNMQQQQLAIAAATDSSVLLKYRAGFTECAGEVGRYLGTIDGLSAEVHSRLLNHLGNCMVRIGSVCETSSMMGGQHHVPMATNYTSLPGSHVPGCLPTLQPGREVIHSQRLQQVAPQYSGSFQVIPGAYMYHSQHSSAFIAGDQHRRADLTLDMRRRSDSMSSCESNTDGDLDIVSRSGMSPVLKDEPPHKRIKTEPVSPPCVQNKRLIPPQQVLKQEDMWRPW